MEHHSQRPTWVDTGSVCVTFYCIYCLYFSEKIPTSRQTPTSYRTSQEFSTWTEITLRSADIPRDGMSPSWSHHTHHWTPEIMRTLKWTSRVSKFTSTLGTSPGLVVPGAGSHSKQTFYYEVSAHEVVTRERCSVPSVPSTRSRCFKNQDIENHFYTGRGCQWARGKFVLMLLRLSHPKQQGL